MKIKIQLSNFVKLVDLGISRSKASRNMNSGVPFGIISESNNLFVIEFMCIVTKFTP